jgi:hypothetical protein
MKNADSGGDARIIDGPQRMEGEPTTFDKLL